MKVRFGLAALTVALSACGDSDVSSPPPAVAIDSVYWSMTLNHHAVRMSMTAPYDTLTLRAVARNLRGEPIPTDATPVFTSSSPDQLHVDENGVLHARSSGAQILVTGALSFNGLTHRDSLYVDVVNETNPKVLSTFSIQIAPPDSAKIARDAFDIFHPRTVPVVALDADGQPMPVTLAFFSSDTMSIMVNRFTGVLKRNYFVTPSGTVYITASTTSFGIRKTDVLEYRVGLPIEPRFKVVYQETLGGRVVAFEPAKVIAGVGANVGWANMDGIPDVTIEFEDPDQAFVPRAPCFAPDCGSGNIVTPIPPSFFISFPPALRSFRAPGIYKFHSPTYGIHGQITILAE